MPTTGPGLQAFRFDDPCQERIHRRLQLIGPEPAVCYRDALPPEWRQQYETWVREVGEPEHPEFVAYYAGS